MFVLLLILYCAEIISCTNMTHTIITGIQCKSHCRSAAMRCTNATVPGLLVDRAGAMQFTYRYGAGAAICTPDTVATSLEIMEDIQIRLGCSRLGRMVNSNVVPKISNTYCQLLELKDGEMKDCPTGYAMNGIMTTERKFWYFFKKQALKSIQCCLIMAPNTIGSAPVKEYVSVPMGTILPSAIVVNGTAIGNTQDIVSPLNTPNNAPNNISDAGASMQNPTTMTTSQVNQILGDELGPPPTTTTKATGGSSDVPPPPPGP